jgi:hypothetical protein
MEDKFPTLWTTRRWRSISPRDWSDVVSSDHIELNAASTGQSGVQAMLSTKGDSPEGRSQERTRRKLRRPYPNVRADCAWIQAPRAGRHPNAAQRHFFSMGSSEDGLFPASVARLFVRAHCRALYHSQHCANCARLSSNEIALRSPIARPKCARETITFSASCPALGGPPSPRLRRA